jgi:hypothetical protein
LEEIHRLDAWEVPNEVDEYDLFTYPKEMMRRDNAESHLASWKPMPDVERCVFDEIVENGDFRLGQITDSVFQGLITGWNKVFVGEVVGDPEDGVVQFVRRGGDEPEPIEESLLRRLLKGKEIDHWGADWNGLWLLFPYEVEGSEVELIERPTLEHEYPHTWEFFQNHEDELKGREGGKWKDVEQWWAFGRSQNLAKMEPDKIMTNIMSDYNRFAVDTEGEYYFIGGGNAGGYGIDLMDEYAPASEDHLYYVALLNSSVLEFWHKHIAPIFGGKYYSYNKRYLEPHPIVLPENAPEETVASLAEEIKTTREEITNLEYKTSDVRNYLSDYDRSATVLDLAQSLSLDDDDYRQGPIRKDMKMDVETTDGVYQVVMKRGHKIGFGDERVRDFVYEMLTAKDHRLTRSEVMNVDIPGRGDVIELMDQHEADVQRIGELEDEFVRLQDDLDEMILREVYGLGDDEESVVDEFLEVW